MKKIALLLAGLGFCLLAQADEPVKNFSFAGYKAVFIPADTFRIEVGNPDLGIQKLRNGTLSFELKDANGRMPKDVVYIYTNDVRWIGLTYSVLVAEEPITADSLRLSLGAGSRGSVNVKTKYLQVSAGGGSHLTLQGETDVLNCTTKGYSSVNTKKLKAKKKECKELPTD